MSAPTPIKVCIRLPGVGEFVATVPAFDNYDVDPSKLDKTELATELLRSLNVYVAERIQVEPLAGEVDRVVETLHRWAHVVPLTCDDCPHTATCPWAFDAYNTNGDCLAEK
ncbi:MAG: hypothetical protein ACTHU0_00195 [Kofleriaceae bacterium]